MDGTVHTVYSSVGQGLMKGSPNSDSDDESNSSGANETLKEGQNNKSFSDKKEGKCVCGCGGTREPGGCLVCKRPTELAPGLQDANSLVSDISVAQLESP